MFTSKLLKLILLIGFATCITCQEVSLDNGTIINGRYKVEDRIGSGGFATVYKVFDKDNKTVWAMKIQENGPGRIPLSVEYRFYEKLQCKDPSRKSPGLPLVGEYNTYKSYEFFIMEYFSESFPKVTLSKSQALQAIVQVITILEHMHSNGVIHRDIKKENMVMRNGQIVLIDFGAAQLRTTRSEFTGIFNGSLNYASLRALRFLNGDQRCDLESWGYNSMELLNVFMPFVEITIDHEVDKRLLFSYKRKYGFIKEGIKDKYFRKGEMSGIFVKYFEYLETLNFGQQPNYEQLRRLFKQNWWSLFKETLFNRKNKTVWGSKSKLPSTYFKPKCEV